jgi:hypothetical protein
MKYLIVTTGCNIQQQYPDILSINFSRKSPIALLPI